MTGVIFIVAALGAVAAIAALVAVFRATREGPAELRGLLEGHALRLDRVSDALGRQTDDDRVLREEMDATRRAVEDLRAREEERRSRDEEGRASLRRLEATFLGASARGRAGENVVWEALSLLPPDMVDRGFRVNGKVVEFSLKLPDGKRLPVDCKWSAMAEVEALETAEGPDRKRLADEIERLVAGRAREVSKYLEPSLTAPFAVAAVPDAVHGVVRKAHLDAFAAGVLIVPFSSALPVLLALYALCARMGTGATDLGAVLTELGTALDAIERALENQVERGTKMAQNAASDIRAHLGQARGSLARGRAQSEIGGPGPRPLGEDGEPPLHAVR